MSPKQSFTTMLQTRAHYLVEQFFSTKLIFLSIITFCYCWYREPFDWAYVAIFSMTLTFREGKELLTIWKKDRAD